jgi:hypothetical protein
MSDTTTWLAGHAASLTPSMLPNTPAAASSSGSVQCTTHSSRLNIACPENSAMLSKTGTAQCTDGSYFIAQPPFDIPIVSGIRAGGTRSGSC